MDNNIVRGAGTAAGIDTYTVTLSVGDTAYVTNGIYIITFTNANTGASTLNVNALGAKAIKDQAGVALLAGAIDAGSILVIAYDGTNMVLQNGIGNTDIATQGEVDAGVNALKAIAPNTNAVARQSNRHVSGTLAGADTKTATLTPTLLSYAQAQTFVFKNTTTNTGAVTINIDTVGALAVKNPDGSALNAGDMQGGAMVIVSHNGTDFTLISGRITENLYVIDGTLTADRTVTLVTFDLAFNTTGQSNMLFIDGANDRIGIGTSTPGDELSIDISQNEATNIRVTNSNSGSSSTASVATTNDVGSGFSMVNFGSNTASSGTLTSDNNYLKGSGNIFNGGAGLGDINIGNREATKVIRFFTGNVAFNIANLVMTLESNGDVHIHNGALILDKNLDHNGTNVGFFSKVPATQASDAGVLTDNTGGTANSTLVAVPVINGSGATTAQEAAINDNFADLTAKINLMRLVLQRHGLMA